MASLATFQTLEEAFLHCRDMDASLAEQLEAFSLATRYLLPGYQEAVDSMASRLKLHEAGRAAPKIGDRMPVFVLPDEHGELLSLEQLLEKGPVATLPGDAGYSPLWLVSIYDNADFPLVRDRATALKAKVLAAGAATVNCPIVFIEP